MNRTNENHTGAEAPSNKQNAQAQVTAALDSENLARPDGGLPAAPCSALIAELGERPQSSSFSYRENDIEIQHGGEYITLPKSLIAENLTYLSDWAHGSGNEKEKTAAEPNVQAQAAAAQNSENQTQPAAPCSARFTTGNSMPPLWLSIIFGAIGGWIVLYFKWWIIPNIVDPVYNFIFR